MYNNIIKCCRLFKQATSSYLSETNSPAKWTKYFLQLGYSGIHDPGFGIIHPNEPACGVMFGNKFLEVLGIVNNQNAEIKFIEKNIDKNLNVDLEYRWFKIKHNTPIIQIIGLLDEIIQRGKYNAIVAGNLKYKIDINKLPKKLLEKIIKIGNKDDLEYIIIKTNNLEIVIDIAIIGNLYVYNFLLDNKNFSKEEKEKLINLFSNKINNFDEESALTLIKISKNKYKNENIELPSSLDILKQYVDKPYHYIHYTNTPQLFGINPNYEFGTPIGIYGYILNTATYNKIKQAEKFNFATERSHIVMFKAKNPDTILDLKKYTENSLEQDVKKLKILFPNNIEDIEQLYRVSKTQSSVDHPGSRLFYITLLL